MGKNRINMVTKCICYDLDFAEILFLALKNNWSLSEVQKNLGCGSACGMCLQYIEICLKTHETVFDVRK